MSAAAHPNFRLIRCPECAASLESGAWGSERQTLICPRCQSRLLSIAFPMLGRQRPGTALGQTATEGEAVCFFHTGKRAAITCDRCGRFLCELCDMPLGARHLCPTCIGGGLETGKVVELVNRRVCWSSLSFLLGALPITVGLIFYPMILATGPAAVATAIYGWKKPGSLVMGRRRWLAVLGGLLGLVQISAVTGLGFVIWKAARHV